MSSARRIEARGMQTSRRTTTTYVEDWGCNKASEKTEDDEGLEVFGEGYRDLEDVQHDQTDEERPPPAVVLGYRCENDLVVVIRRRRRARTVEVRGDDRRCAVSRSTDAIEERSKRKRKACEALQDRERIRLQEKEDGKAVGDVSQPACSSSKATDRVNAGQPREARLTHSDTSPGVSSPPAWRPQTRRRCLHWLETMRHRALLSI